MKKIIRITILSFTLLCGTTGCFLEALTIGGGAIATYSQYVNHKLDKEKFEWQKEENYKKWKN